MPECVKHSTVFLYADDAKLLKPITCLLDCLLFQQGLDAVADWCSTWQLTLNISKCLYTHVMDLLISHLSSTVSQGSSSHKSLMLLTLELFLIPS